MENARRLYVLLLFLTLFCGAAIARGSRVQISSTHNDKGATFHISSAQEKLNFKDDSRRSMIGSVAPTCTYNECRGCKYKCRAEQVPIEGNDPMNSAYHYRCVCHR